MARSGQFIAVQQRGLLALPKGVRTRFGLDRPGAQVEVVERDDGVIELHPHVAVPADQAWFWTERWQRMEREVDEQIDRGELTTFDSSDDFLSSLEKVESDR
jgi:antitoxin MazE